MASLSLLTGPMALLAAVASASEVFTPKAPESTIAAAAPSTQPPSPSPSPTTNQTETASQPPPPPPAPTTAAASIHLLSLRSPTAALAYRCHRGAAHAWSRARIAAKPAVWAAQKVARLLLLLGALSLTGLSSLAGVVGVAGRRLGRLCLAAGQAAWQTAWQACWWHLWACKPATRLRKKLYFELALAFLGPGGNGFLLVVLWPGWLVLAAAAWAVWGLAAAAWGFLS